MEGVVAKNYARFGKDGKVLMGKYACPKFKEVHNKNYKEENPGNLDMIANLGVRYHSEARFAKAVQHLTEAGELVNEPKDIGPLIDEIRRDIVEECEWEIKEALFKWAWKRLSRSVVAGFPEWYKNLLMEDSFESEVEVDECDSEEGKKCEGLPDGESEGDSGSLHESDQFDTANQCCSEQLQE
jgi:hypothetical protein